MYNINVIWRGKLKNNKIDIITKKNYSYIDISRNESAYKMLENEYIVYYLDMLINVLI